MTVGFEVVRERVVTAPPIIRRFVGQPWANLTDWLEKQPGYLLERTDRLIVPPPLGRPCDQCGCPQPPHRCFCSLCQGWTHDRRWRAVLAEEANEIPHKDGKNVQTLWPEIAASYVHPLRRRT